MKIYSKMVVLITTLWCDKNENKSPRVAGGQLVYINCRQSNDTEKPANYSGQTEGWAPNYSGVDNGSKSVIVRPGHGAAMLSKGRSVNGRLWVYAQVSEWNGRFFTEAILDWDEEGEFELNDKREKANAHKAALKAAQEAEVNADLAADKAAEEAAKKMLEIANEAAPAIGKRLKKSKS